MRPQEERHTEKVDADNQILELFFIYCARNHITNALS